MKKKKLFLPGIEGSLWRESSHKWRGGDLENMGEVENVISQGRFYLFRLVIFLILLVFLARLFGLTIISGAKNRELSEGNRVKLTEVEAERGKILDRFGKTIAYSARQFYLLKGETKSEISQEVAKQLERDGRASEDFEGDAGTIAVQVNRKYPLGEAAAHVLGYTSVAQEEEVNRDRTISTVNSVGRLGLENTYNNFLQGKLGKKLVEVDALGKNVSILGTQDAYLGRDLHATLDADLQKVSFEALKKYAQEAGSKKGAVIAQDPATGEVLALASSPSFDPEDIGRSVTDVNKPFFNRAVQGNFPPGSVFKITAAIAGLESGTITKDSEFEDVGQFELGGERFSNWFFNQYGKTDGVIKIERAITRSNDIYFYRMAEKMGLEPIRQTAMKLGFGQKTGIDLPDEGYGLVPDEVWKKSAVGDNWYTGDTLHIAIGQGFVLTTPMQINQMTSYVASGKLTKPYLVSKVDAGLEGGEIAFESKVLAENLFSQANLNLIRSGMKGACQAGGTGAPFFRASYKVACKTGTAEEVGGKPHAWFTVFAPADKPKIAMTVLVERGGEGSAVAAPVAKEVLDWWMTNRGIK